MQEAVVTNDEPGGEAHSGGGPGGRVGVVDIIPSALPFYQYALDLGSDPTHALTLVIITIYFIRRRKRRPGQLPALVAASGILLCIGSAGRTTIPGCVNAITFGNL